MAHATLQYESDLSVIEKATTDVLKNVFENLKTQTAVKVEGSTRLFYPNGIELISVGLKFNLKDGFDVQVKIAGEKGVKGTTLSGDGLEDAYALSSVGEPD